MNQELEKELNDFALIAEVKSCADKISTHIGFEYFSHQLELAIAIIKHNLSVINLPTGVGKCFICAIVASYYSKRDESVTFIYPVRMLVEQSEQNFKKYNIVSDKIKHTTWQNTRIPNNNISSNKVIIVN